jgi:predicted phage tail protein
VDFALGPAAGVPQAPVEFRAHASAFTAHLSWTPPFYGPIPTGYLVEAGLTSGATFVTLPITGNTLSVPGVPPGRYFVRVRAVNAVGLSLPSNEVALNLGAGGSTAFSAPRDFRAGINDRRLTLAWADAEAEGLPTGYVIEAGSSARLSNIASLPWSSRSFTFEGLPNGVYFIRVRSRRGAELSPATREVMIVVGNQPSPPDLPRNFSHTVSGATLSLTWQAPLFGTASSYVIEAGTASGLSEIVVFNTGSAAQSATFNNVPSGTYYVRVRAVNGVGESVASDERTIIIP